jgi:peptidoglycan/xylan/chitin deacetylase (PgdA/CDA1 family)
MRPRSKWDYARRLRAVKPPRRTFGSHSSARRQGSIRRRRAVAILVLAGVAAVAVASLLGARSHSAASPVRAMHQTYHRATSRPPDVQEAAAKAISRVLSYTPFVKEGAEHGHDIALTFDDGPGPYTPGVLRVLERMHVHATFFEIGKMLQYFSSSSVRELEDGDVIGDHTETHPEMATLSAHEQFEELFEQIARIELIGGPRPQLFRPPYGSFDATTMRELRRLHLLMVLWSVDTDDYLQPGVSVIVHNALAGAHAGAIILMHDAGGDRTQTIAALPQIIRALRARGFHLVTVPELLADDPPPPGLPIPPSLRGD